MSGYLLVFAILLAGQVNSPIDPYGTTGQTPPAAENPPPAQTDNGLVTGIEPPPATARATQQTVPPASRNPDQYGAPAAASSNQRAFPFSGATSPQSAAVPPSGFGGLSGQSAAPPPTAPPANPGTPTVGMKPSALMRTMLTPPRASRLSGQPITLAEVIAGATSRAEQSQRIEAYWDLCSSVADYYLGLGEQDELRRLRSSVQRTGATWEQAEKELAVRIGTAERAARASQHRLASWGGVLGSMPLPGDMPHCGNYHSHYDQIFAGRPSTEAQELSALLPLRYAELKDAAMAVARAGEWLNAIAAVRNENSDGTGTLRALELWALRRRAFIQIARDYNRRISRYSELATPGQVPADRLVGMLIFRDEAATATRNSSPTPLPNRQSNNDGRTVPPTFSGGWLPAATGAPRGTTRDDEVEPASAESSDEPRQERSLLVKPPWDR